VGFDRSGGFSAARGRSRRLASAVTLLAAVAALAVACSSGSGSNPAAGGAATSGSEHDHDSAAATVIPGSGTPAPGTSTAPTLDLYAHTRAGDFSPTVKGDPSLVYVPNLSSNSVSVIDPKTFKVIYTIPVGEQPQHVVPSWDLKTLWVNNNASNSLTPIDPRTGRIKGPNVPVDDPYNLYFTPDGKSALVMAESEREIVFRDPQTMALQYRLHVPTCPGVNHADFSPDGSYLIATCEYAGNLIKVDLRTRTVVATMNLNIDGPSAPQDIKIDPYGQIWYVADMNRNGLWEITGSPFKRVGFLPTGPETHGLYPSRDGKDLYVANRGGRLIGTQAQFYYHEGDNGSVSVVSFATRKVVANWAIPGGGTPDMGNVSADGSQLWLSGRRNNVVYVFDTRAGKLIHEIPVGKEPHGLAIWPLPGRYSLGHTGILR
jgi:YVTN family beta-propeller protein